VVPTATDFRSSQALQRYPEPGRAVARPVLVMIIGALGSFEGRPVMCLASAGVLFMTFIRKSGRTHTKLGKGSYDKGVPYGAGVGAVAAG
jgi:hypothetical protein